jgi:hypothetical protein
VFARVGDKAASDDPDDAMDLRGEEPDRRCGRTLSVMLPSS